MTTTKIETVYPADPDGLSAAHSNHVNINCLAEEVYLDFTTIQLEAVSPSDVQEDGAVKRVPAMAHTRMLLTKAHARRLALVLLEMLGSPDAAAHPTPEKPQPTQLWIPKKRRLD